MLSPHRGLKAAGFLLSTIAAATAAAQSTPSSATAEAENGTLEKVVVKASRENALSTKLPLTRREIPQSISTVDQQRLEAEAMFSINDVLMNVTGVNVTFYDTQRPLYYARGFQITDFQVDGIPTYSSSTNQEYDTALYERIEVVRGANGLLSGAGVPSATVNLVRKRPGKVFDASLAASAGSWNYLRTEADLNVPLTQDGRFRSRFVAAWQDRDSFRDRYTEDKTAWLAVVEGDLTPTTTVAIGYQNQDNNPVGSIWGTIPRFAADGSLAELPRSTSFSPSWTRWQRESGTAFATLDQQLGTDWLLKAIYNRTRGDVSSLRVYGTGYPDMATGAGMKLLAGVGEGKDTLDSLDVYASGRFALFGREHDLVLGASKSKLESTTFTLSSVAGWSYQIPDLSLWDGNAPLPAYSRTGASRIAVTEQSGVYTTARWRLLQPLALITGVRLSQWKTRTDAYDTTGGFTGSSGAYKVDDEVTPYVGLVYDINRDVSAYASYTGIFKPQNYKDKDNSPLAPVEGSSAELGVKAALFDKRLNASFAIFQAKQDHYAVRDATQPDNSLPDGSSAYIGVNGTESKGFEFDVSGLLRPGWSLNAGFTHVKTTRAKTDLIYANLPENYLQLSTSYQLGGAWNRLTLGGGVNWQSEIVGFNIPHPTQGTVTVKQAAYALVNLHANYRITEQVTATLSVRNAFDKRYWANLDYPNYGEPRNITASLRWRL